MSSRRVLLYLCILISIVRSIERVQFANKSPNLLFRSTLEGLFAIFMQYKIIHQVCNLLGCTLTFLMVPSNHGYSVRACEIFDLPNTINCLHEWNGPSEYDCKYDLIDVNLVPGKDSCLLTNFHNISLTGARPLIAETIGSYTWTSLPGLPMIIKEDHRKVADIIRVFFGVFPTRVLHDNLSTKKIKSLLKDYTAVHWRRGDQLTTRCVGKAGGIFFNDTSVNCDGPEDLIDMVRRSTSHRIIYVATNEDEDSEAHEILFKSGFVTYVSLQRHWHDILKWSGVYLSEELTMKSIEKISSQGSLEILLTETILMLEASTFLGWGASTVNDVVEHDRMMNDRSYCAGRHDEFRNDLTGFHAFCDRFPAGTEKPKPGSSYRIHYLNETLVQYCRLYPQDCRVTVDGKVPVKLEDHPPIPFSIKSRSNSNA